MDNLCNKCVFLCIASCPATYADVEYAGEGTPKDTIVQCDKYQFAKTNEPRGGCPMDKNIEDFKQIAYNMRQEGEISRADAIMYLIERVKIAEGRCLSVRPESFIVINRNTGEETGFGNLNLAKDFLCKCREEKPENKWSVLRRSIDVKIDV